MDVFECIESRRSIREYAPKRVPRAATEKILHAGVMAPSAMHALPWKFIVIEDKAKQDELSGYALAAYGRIQGGLAKIAFLRGKNVFHDAPLVVLIVCEENGKWFREDAAAAAQNMFLAARSLGIGSCFIGMAVRLNESNEALAAAGVPKRHKVFAALAFGYPAKGWPKAEKREPKIISWA